MPVRASWETVWADVARAVSRRSSCDRAQIGAVLVKDNRVVATGYNGPAPRDPADTELGCQSWCLRAQQNPSLATGYGFGCPSIHAEANALLAARRDDVLGATLYVTNSPCADCAKLVAASGVARVVVLNPPDLHRPDAVPYLTACQIEVVFL